MRCDFDTYEADREIRGYYSEMSGVLFLCCSPSENLVTIYPDDSVVVVLKDSINTSGMVPIYGDTKLTIILDPK